MEFTTKNLILIRDALMSHASGLKLQRELIRKYEDVSDDATWVAVLDLGAEISRTELLQEMVETMINRQ